MIKKYFTYVNESFNDIGKIVKIKKESPYTREAYDKYPLLDIKGDGCGIITEYDPDESKFNYKIKWNNGFQHIYNISDFDIIGDAPEIEPQREPRIKWYKDGKLDESLNDIGRRVAIKKDSPHWWDAIKIGMSGNIGYGDGYITSYNKNKHGYDYSIIWDNGNDGNYQRSDFNFKDELPPKPPRIRWYKDGKLDESKEDIGRGVRINDDSPYVKEAYTRDGDGIGELKDYNPPSSGMKLEDYHSYHIRWNNGVEDGYRRRDFEFIDKIGKSRIRWYKDGKLQNENLIYKNKIKRS